MEKKVLIVGLFIALFAVFARAQFEYVKPADLKDLISRKVIVLIEEPKDIITLKLAKKNKDANAYKNAIDTYNKYMRHAVTKFWNLSKTTIEFKTRKELDQIPDKKDYVVIFCRTTKQYQMDQGYPQFHGLLWWPNFKEVARDKDFVGAITSFGISFLDKFDMVPIYQCPVPDVFPTQADLDYVINVVGNYLLFRDAHRKVEDYLVDQVLLKENQPELKNKILLLRRDQLDRKITDARIIKKIYPYPYLITSRDTIERAIESADKRYAVAIVTPYDLDAAGSGGIEYVQYAYSTGDGLILGSSGLLDMPTADNSTASTLAPLINKRCLLDFKMYIKPKSNPAPSVKKGNATKK